MEITGRLNRTTVGLDKTTKVAVVSEQSRQKRLSRERWALEIAKYHGVLVPSVIDYKEVAGIETLVLETITGKTLSFSETKSNIEAMFLVGRQLSSMGHLGNIGFGWPHPETLRGEFETWELFLTAFVQKYGNRLSNCRIVSFGAIDKILKKIIAVSQGLIVSSRLIHRDIKPVNILCASIGPYILDWENALIGDSLFDVAQYGANYGRTKMWQSLADGFGFNSPVAF